MANLLHKVFQANKREAFEDITQQLYLKNVELAHTNQVLAFLRNIDIHVLDSRNTITSLVSLICDELMIANNYAFLCIVTQGELSEKDLLINDIRSSNQSQQKRFQRKYRRAALSREMITNHESMVEIDLGGTDSREGKLLDLGDLSSSFFNDLNTLALTQLIVTKVRSNDSTRGLIITGYTADNPVTTQDKEFMSRISEAFGVALDNKYLDIQLLNTANKLRLSNAKLKELDEAKDDFISMASHQLRTPLTSVKGYLSMMLEGDIGKITKQQREVLEQAYDSSQRMVFLIGDFLNLSRLQTGKFVLEPSSIDFTRLVEEEVEQLNDTAKARHITFSYQMPETPLVAVADENKLRQVMMNFMDNAIFYSPSGKSVDVQLYRDAEEIVFRVVDRGIGVPKAQQAKLFTKFFRADNAKQQRPDGTGIGIYMAKKVVVAHGGSLIFESEEGVGSTFGFRLPLKNELDKLDK